MSYYVDFIADAESDVDEALQCLSQHACRSEAVGWYKGLLSTIRKLGRDPQPDPRTIPRVPESKMLRQFVHHVVFRAEAGRPTRMIFRVQGAYAEVLRVFVSLGDLLRR